MCRGGCRDWRSGRPQGAGQRQTESKYCYKRWWAPWSRQWSNGTGKLRCFGLWGVHFYRWCAPPLVMPPSASYNIQYTSIMPTLASYKATLAFGKPLSRSLGLLECPMYRQAASPSLLRLITGTMAVGAFVPLSRVIQVQAKCLYCLFQSEIPNECTSPLLGDSLAPLTSDHMI